MVLTLRMRVQILPQVLNGVKMFLLKFIQTLNELIRAENSGDTAYVGKLQDDLDQIAVDSARDKPIARDYCGERKIPYVGVWKAKDD